jgi:hypothetical protein
MKPDEKTAPGRALRKTRKGGNARCSCPARWPGLRNTAKNRAITPCFIRFSVKCSCYKSRLRACGPSLFFTLRDHSIRGQHAAARVCKTLMPNVVFSQRVQSVPSWTQFTASAIVLSRCTRAGAAVVAALQRAAAPAYRSRAVNPVQHEKQGQQMFTRRERGSAPSAAYHDLWAVLALPRFAPVVRTSYWEFV